MKKTVAALVAALILMLCSCKGYRETDSEYIISAIGFEAGGGFTVFAEVLDTTETDSVKMQSRLFESTGKTPYEAVDNLINLLSKTAVFDHCGIAVISDNIKDSDFKSVIDYLYNTKNLNLGVYMYKTANVRELLECRSQSGSVGYDIMAIEESAQTVSGISFKNRYYEMLARFHKSGGFCLPQIGVKDNSPAIIGQTVFIDLNPALTLSEYETMLFNILFSGSTGGEISVAGKRLIINGISSDLSVDNGCLYAKLCCDFRFGGDNLCRDLRTETKILLNKIIAANATAALGVGGEVKSFEVSVYGK